MIDKIIISLQRLIFSPWFMLGRMQKKCYDNSGGMLFYVNQLTYQRLGLIA